MFGQLDRERAGRRGLANSTFAADEDPTECLLVEDGLEGGFHDVVVDDEGVGGHGYGLLSCVGWSECGRKEEQDVAFRWPSIGGKLVEGSGRFWANGGVRWAAVLVVRMEMGMGPPDILGYPKLPW